MREFFAIFANTIKKKLYIYTYIYIYIYIYMYIIYVCVYMLAPVFLHPTAILGINNVADLSGYLRVSNNYLEAKKRITEARNLLVSWVTMVLVKWSTLLLLVSSPLIVIANEDQDLALLSSYDLTWFAKGITYYWKMKKKLISFIYYLNGLLSRKKLRELRVEESACKYNQSKHTFQCNILAFTVTDDLTF